jgi:hypothetical protein
MEPIRDFGTLFHVRQFACFVSIRSAVHTPLPRALDWSSVADCRASRQNRSELIDRAAKLAGKNRTDFVLDAARRAAEDTLLDRTRVYRSALRRIASSWRAWVRRRSRKAAAQEHADTLAVGMSVPLSPPEPLGDDHQIEIEQNQQIRIFARGTPVVIK